MDPTKARRSLRKSLTDFVPLWESKRIVIIILMITLWFIHKKAVSQSIHSVNGEKEFAPRTLRYHPEGKDYVIVNGNKRYNRALYGVHNGFRIQAGDIPEFALYLPGTGGDMKLGVITIQGTKWFNDFDTVEARYRPGMMLYKLKDRILGKSEIDLQLLAMSDRQGMILKIRSVNQNKPLNLICAYGGASGIHPSRNGDVGADPPSLYYLTPQHAEGNQIIIHKDYFDLTFKDRKNFITLSGTLPVPADLHIGDANKLQTPEDALQASANIAAPVLISNMDLQNDQPVYVAIQREDSVHLNYSELPDVFRRSIQYVKQLATRVQLQTPDPFMNTLGSAIGIATDAIWQAPAYLHGAQAWRMWLPGWRGIYAADDLGWHGRAKTEFSAYNKMQLTAPDTTISFPDRDENLSRQKEKIGVGIYNSGYITRYPEGKLVPNHYDMNLVYIDAMMRYFLWTGDTAFMRQCWPVIKRHLAWEKRNFDQDNNGLFDAYACIWASDALQYSGGDVSYSSAYNYYENKMAALIASKLGDDPAPYLREAEKIKHAMDHILWMPKRGWYAEYKDRLGLQLLHPDAGLWTIYHTIDEEITDPFQAYQCLRYVDTHIPHIPIQCPSLQKGYYMLSTTDWMPYTWSVNNVAMAEMAHTALAYWEGGRNETAFKIFKSLILKSMYLGNSPGNFEQLSYYDHYRGELYHDFADPIGICSRALVEGLFGIHPDALTGILTIHPGFPQKWDHASIHTPDIDYSYRNNGNKDLYIIHPAFEKPMKLKLRINAYHDKIISIKEDGIPVKWQTEYNSIGHSEITIELPYKNQYHVTIRWGKEKISSPMYDSVAVTDNIFKVASGKAKIMAVKDPQQALTDIHFQNNQLSGKVIGCEGWHTLFIKVKQDEMTWWMPVNFQIRPAYQIVDFSNQDSAGIRFKLLNNTNQNLSEQIMTFSGDYYHKGKMNISARGTSAPVFIPSEYLVPGSNNISVTFDHLTIDTIITNWDLPAINTDADYEMVPLTHYFNDEVTHIFKNKYLSPRPDVPTLQLPVQGIGNWTAPFVNPEVNDSGLRSLARDKGYFDLPDHIPFKTPFNPYSKNILFTSQWNNYPDEVTVPLYGNASHAYFLMAGSTDPMQSGIVNGEVIIHYTDGSEDSLLLKNPGTWWPIEQDYSYDNYAFHCSVPVPWRVHLQTGFITRHFTHYTSIKGFTDLAVPGGAATVLDMPLNKNKTLQSLELKAVANDVVIGLMSVTLLKGKE
ncbi:MAG: DUF4450 domain-containing protein [Chitinophagaceae bacterium]|nr:MAG: DUF4450 domain-containing protein [Chitinophagaceae bacterium]